MPELLSPAGSMDSAFAAIKAGADAIYLGGKNFSARSSAQNFTDDELTSLISYAAVRGVRVYVAVNTLYKNNELPHVLEFVAHMHSNGAAAFILQDPGLAYIMKTKLPQVEIHASTQMSVYSTAGVKYMEGMGFSRAVLARELSLAEVAEISAASNIGCEVFIHGALCIAYSGQCLMSSLIGGRSGNRGKCAQICRTNFGLKCDGAHVKSGYLLSPKDMNTLDILDGIVATGAASLKIEGRMKSAEYVYLVTKAYRQRLDGLVAGVGAQDILQIFNRGGSFTTGYYNTYASPNMMSTQTPKSTGVLVGKVVAYKNGKCKIKFTQPLKPGDGIEIWATPEHIGTGIAKHIAAGETVEFALQCNIGDVVYKSYDKGLIDAIKNEMATTEKRITVDGTVGATIGRPLMLSLSYNGLTTTVYGDIVQAANQAPMAAGDILAQLSKTGNTPFVIDFAYVEIDDNIFIPKAALNKLRRDAVEMLGTEIAASTKRAPLEYVYEAPPCQQEKTVPFLTVQLNNVEHLPKVLELGVKRVYVKLEDVGARTLGSQVFVTLPRISRNDTDAALAKALPQLEADPNIGGYLVSTYGQLQLLQNTTKQIVLDHSFNIFNAYAVRAFNGTTVTLSQELNTKEISAIGGNGFELVVYGRQVLMCMHNCPIGLYSATSKSGKFCNHRGSAAYTLQDKIGMEFPIATDCQSCVAYIYNSKTLDTALKFDMILKTGAQSLRLVFTHESESEIAETITRYQAAMLGEKGKKTTPQKENATYGHFFRGVE